MRSIVRGLPALIVTPRFAAQTELKIARLGDEIVVFHPTSWFSHVLNPAAAAVLDFVSESARSRDEIESLLFDLLDEDARASCAQHADRVIEDLSIIGLIHELPGEPLANR